MAGKLLLVLASTVILASEFGGTHDQALLSQDSLSRGQCCRTFLHENI
jgi:hypothetical protein